jgi:NTE family protein
MKKKQKIGLALGGGAARGFAHIGVIKALEEFEIPIDLISGTSIGSFIGAIYSAGNLKEFEKEIRSKNSFMRDVLLKLDPTFPKLSLMNGNEVIKIFKSLSSARTFEDLSIPLTTVTTGIEKNEKIECSDGDLINAIRASIAIPGVLSPVYINQRLCVDGGLVDPVPVESLYNMGADITIAVNLYGLYSSKHSQENYNIIDIVDRSAKIILNNITQLSFKIHSPDILIEPPIDEFKGWDFHKSSDLIEIGYQETKRVLNNNQETLMKIINLTDPY